MSLSPLAAATRGLARSSTRYVTASVGRKIPTMCYAGSYNSHLFVRRFSGTHGARAPTSELSKDNSPSNAGHRIGTEGLHKHDLPTSSSAAPKAVVMNPDSELQNASLLSMKAAPLAPMAEAAQHHQGDWVLFHPVYTEDELKAVRVLQHERYTMGDKVASLFVAFLRKGFDVLSGYKHKPFPPNYTTMSVEELRKGSHTMDPSQWLMRILFLETIAGVPGFTAAMIRHLRSLRIMKRDGGWIHMLLEEAENERMHLMTFMTLKEPSIWFRGLILGAQGVFANCFFLAYLVSPKICHRFVGILEEEATVTYTRLIGDIEAGYLPEWSNKPAPAIAIDYWRLKPNATLLDVIYAVRSDESTHRFVNHTLANLDPKEDINPFALGEPDMTVKGTKAGFSRVEAAEYMKANRTRAENVAAATSGQ